MLQCSAVMISHDNFKSSCHTRTSFYYRMYVDVSLQVTVLWVFVSKLTLELNLKMNLSQCCNGSAQNGPLFPWSDATSAECYTAVQRLSLR